ncbi:hypothetical protein BV25DRAFT_1922323 [Artomyces pyxidatus]|uniref:Uncharacterized protein n=1 Tax=Artomyces pyxidatus TaxID=48021 RepID=A0ACB8SF08_9AGAM|nr:hypothetical protein BV25DRAFT_1922323 [Artomyces pyxidatus]
MPVEDPISTLRTRIRSHLAQLEVDEDNMDHAAKFIWGRTAIPLFLKTFQESMAGADFGEESDALSEAVTRIGDSSWHTWARGLYAPPPTFERQLSELKARLDEGLLSLPAYEGLRYQLHMASLAGRPVPELPFQQRRRHYTRRPRDTSGGTDTSTSEVDTGASLDCPNAIPEPPDRDSHAFASGDRLSPTLPNPGSPGSSAENPLYVDVEDAEDLYERAARTVGRAPRAVARPDPHCFLDLRRVARETHRRVDRNGKGADIQTATDMQLSRKQSALVRAIHVQHSQVLAEMRAQRDTYAQLYEEESRVMDTALSRYG